MHARLGIKMGFNHMVGVQQYSGGVQNKKKGIGLKEQAGGADSVQAWLGSRRTEPVREHIYRLCWFFHSFSQTFLSLTSLSLTKALSLSILSYVLYFLETDGEAR